jgi:hypothetical protein
MAHKRDEPYAFVDLSDAYRLAGQGCAQVDLFSIDTDAAAVSNVYGFVVEPLFY